MRPTTVKRRGCRYWRNLALVALAGLLVGLLVLCYGVFPVLNGRGAAHPKRASVCCTTPGDLGLDYQEVSFTTADGLTLRGWYVPSQNGAAVIVAHGMAGNRLAHLPLGAALARHGYGVLLFDERAHGESDGDTSTFGGEDVLAALAYLQNRPDVDPNRIGALGVSLGGLVIIQAAVRDDALRAIVAEGPGPGTYQDMIRTANVVDWLWAPFDWMWYKTLKREGVTAPIPLAEALPRLAPRPVLLISCAAKRYERHAVRHYYALAAEPKTLWEIPEAKHAGGWKARPKEYEDKIVTFFDRALLAGE